MKRDMNAPQPDPKPGRASVTDEVIEDLLRRRQGGIEKYKGELKSGNGREALIDAYQEALDMALYLRQRTMEDQDREEAKVELGKLRTALFQLRDTITPSWHFEDMLQRLDFIEERL